MICVSIKNKSFDQIVSILDRPEVEMAEIRLDGSPLSDEDIDLLFSGTDKPLIATCRISPKVSPQLSEHLLSLAIEAGAKYVDLELEAPVQMGKRIVRLAREKGTVCIRSYHNYECTPSAEALSEFLSRCHRFGGEIAKIAVYARTADDVRTVQTLYNDEEEGRLLAFCMGPAGVQSRIESLALGAPFTYACLTEKDATASGQMPLDEVVKILYGDTVRPPVATVTMPSSKSFAQRAILAAALASGRSVLHGYTECDDSEAALRVAREIGATVTRRGNTLTINGIAGRRVSLDELPCGESGLLARLLIPVLASISDSPVTITGKGTLLNRPLKDANDIMAAFGVMLRNCGKQSRKDVFVPLQIDGRLLAGRADVSGRGGSQLISGLLMALPMAEKNSAIFVHDPRSIPYMVITMDVLRKFGIIVGSEMEGGDEFMETQDWSLCTSMNFKIRGGQSYQAASFDIEGDWSGAAPFMVAAAIFGGVRITGLDTSSLQADLTIMDILVEAGACVSQDDDGVINVFKAPLDPFNVDLNHAPDLFPAVSVLAAFCPGESRIAGMGRLSGKESNRGEALVSMLSALGVDVSVEGDEMVIRGHSLSQRIASGNLLKGGEFSSHHDHRMVMALSIAALGADGAVRVDDTGCVSKSYPGFGGDFERCFGTIS